MIEIKTKRIGDYLDVKIISDFQKQELEHGMLLDIEEAMIMKDKLSEIIEELDTFIEK